MRIFKICLLLLCLQGTSWLAGCGQKGDLYLPDEQQREKR
jgi:predicted small lipoprotein YifL